MTELRNGSSHPIRNDYILNNYGMTGNVLKTKNKTRNYDIENETGKARNRNIKIRFFFFFRKETYPEWTERKKYVKKKQRNYKEKELNKRWAMKRKYK